MGGWYLKDPETVKDWGFSLTTVAFRKEDLKKRLEKSERLRNGEEDPLTVAQRYLNVYRQMHIFSKEKKADKIKTTADHCFHSYKELL